jgi:hypothetical protein
MKRFSVKFLFLIPGLFSCQPEERKIAIPSGILTMDSIALVMHDIHAMESALLVSGIRQDSAQSLYRLVMEPEMLKKYHLDTARLNKSLRFYASEPVLLDSIYQLVLKKTDSTANISH